MSSVKEPYIISVWEEELIPVQDWYVKGEEITNLTEEQYNAFEPKEKELYYLNEEGKYVKKEVRLTIDQYDYFLKTEKNKYIINDDGEYVGIDGVALTEEEFQERMTQIAETYKKYTIMEHYEEVQGVIISSNDMDSVYSAVNPIFKENVNGSVELTFSLYYKIFDPETGEFSMNPFVSMLTNEAKIKLKFRNKWYDLVVKSCQEDSTNYMFTYTCKDFYINELSKNGFKVELDAELENNQGSVIELGKTILKETDWQINEDKTDIIVETKTEPLYIGLLKYDINIERVNEYIPDTMVEIKNYPETAVIEAGKPILLFYSELIDRKKEPQILAVFEKVAENQFIYKEPSVDAEDDYYLLDTNEDVITNGCNYRIISYGESEENNKVQYADSAMKDNLINIIDTNGLFIYERARAEKVVRSQKTGYDPDMDRFISKYYKLVSKDPFNPDIKEPDTETEYYGYAKEDILRTNIAENLLANSDNFTTTDTGWVFDGVPEKRSKKREAGYVGQIFERTTINEANPSSGVLFEESVLELNLKAKDNGRKYKDTQGKYYYIERINENFATGEKTKEPVFILVDSEEAKTYEETVFDLYKKYQREGTPGYAEKTDNELDAMVNEYLSSIRYSESPRVAINTGVAANRDKIKQLSPGEEYIFAVSLGKFKEGETPLELKKSSGELDNITYGVDTPDAYYEFINVKENYELAYNAANKVIDQFKEELKTGAMNYYKQEPTYQGIYSEKYDAVYNDLKEEYKKRYLRTSGFSNDRTKKNWQPGGRRRQYLHGVIGKYIGYYQIFLNVLRGTGEDSAEECCDGGYFLTELDKALTDIKNGTNTTKGGISRKIYYALIDKETIQVPDDEGVIHTYFQGLYPEMVAKTMVHSQEKQKNQLWSKRAAYDIMGYDKGMYPEYDEDTNSLVPMTDSFNEFLFSEFYYGIINKWLVASVDNPNSASFNYSGQDDLVTLLTTIYNACYENTNTIFESVEYAKKYYMPSAFNQSGGEYYQIHEANWQKKAKAAADEAVKQQAEADGKFKPPFEYEEDIVDEDKVMEESKKEDARQLRESFITRFCGSERIYDDDGNFTGVYEGSKDNLAEFCYKKEQEWLATRTETQLQSSEFANLLVKARQEWIKDYADITPKIEVEDFGGSLYSAYLLGKFYPLWSAEEDIGTYTYNTDTYELNYTDNNTSNNAQGVLEAYRPISKEKERYEEVTNYFYNNIAPNLQQYVQISTVKDEYGDEYITNIKVEENKVPDDLKDQLMNLKTELTDKINSANQKEDGAKINWEKITHYTHAENATHFATIDNKYIVDGVEHIKTEQEKTGGYVFDRSTNQIRLFDPYLDVLNATFIPEKDDDGAYVFDPFTWQYRPFRDWDSKEYRDPLTLEIDKKAGVPGDKVYHPLKLFDGHLGAWHDVPTRYNMIRKYEDPNAEKNADGSYKYGYLSEDITLIETGHYDGKDYKYEITYPKGYQYDIYVEAPKGKYILAKDVNTRRLFDLNNDGVVGIKFSLNGTDFGSLIDTAIQNVGNFFNELGEGFKKLFGIGQDTQSWLQELKEAFNTKDDDANKNAAGLANSNVNKESQKQKSNDERYDEDRISINLYGIERNNKIINGIALPTLDEVVNASEFANIIKSGKAKVIEKEEIDQGESVGDETTQTKTRMTSPKTTGAQPAKQYIKYRSYYWRHWGKTRYDYQPKICIQQTVDGIVTYKPYNNIEDKKSEAYFVHSIERDENNNPINLPTDKTVDEIVFLKDRKTTYRQRVETDYEGYKYRMEKVDDMSKNYWIEAPNGENYLRRYKFGDGKTKIFDGHLGRWVQCYSAYKVLSSEKKVLDDKYLPDFYIPYNDIMIPYNNRIFDATTQLTRIRTDYKGNNDEVYVYHNNIYMTLTQYLEEVGYSFDLDYSDLKVSFIDNYDYDSTSFSITLPEKPNRYLEFDLGADCNYIDLVVKENTLTSEVVKERWAYWIAPVTKGFSLTEDPLSRLGMLFETTKASDKKGQIKSNEIGRYAFLGMQLFKNVPYTKNLKDITIWEMIFPCLPKKEDESDKEFEERQKKENRIINILNAALTNIYREDYSISDFMPILKDNPGALTILNSASEVRDNDITIFTDINDDGEEILIITEILSAESITIPLFPGQAPDAEDLHFTNYYIYDPDVVDYSDSAIFEYVGQDYSDNFVPAYDETCQKIRSIKGKESNYFKLLQDCCSTFDCWMQKDIEHDPTTGQIKYCDIPVYTEILKAEDVNVEPQIFVGETAKIEGTKKAAERIHRKLYRKIRIVGTTDESFKEYSTYEQITDKEMEWTDKEQRLLLRLNRVNNLSFNVEYMRVPDKQIYFKRYVGEEKWNGFKYGVNLKHIKRTIDSSQFSTRVIVKPNNNEFGKDKFCSIARATENPIKENFIYDFSYYIHNKLLDNSDLVGDLYTDVNTRLNYYPRLASLNRERDELIIKQSSLATGLDNVTAKYETTIQLRDAALEEITKLTQLLTANYDTYGQVISVPWKYNKSQEYVQKRQTSSPGTSKIISDAYGEEGYTYEVAVPTITTVAEYPKYNDTMRSYLDQMDTYQKEYTASIKLLEELEPEKIRIESELAEIEAYLEEIANKKNELNKLFYHKYSRYIQEGSWIDENYIDDNLYYLDALSVSRLSSKPKVTYDIGVVDIAAAYEYEEDRIVLESELGDRTYIEDTEFFGYRKEDHTKPYWELVVVTEKTYNITDPSQNQIKVRNYTTQFEDIFQTITAASQTLQFNEGSYGRMSQLMNEDGTLKSDVLQESISSGDFILANATNENVKIDKTGVTITSTANRANVVKLVSAGILVSSDGGNHYSTAITGDGINADLLLAGTINTDKLLIGGHSNPNFMWNRLGISSFSTNGDKIDYSSFVRMDQYGIYGIKNYSKNGRAPEFMSLNDAFEPLRLKDITENPNAVFGLTWEGFFLNAANGTGKVTIGTGQDFKMSEYSVDQSRWIDRVVIGRLDNNNYYGFQLKNSDGQVVMETGDTGELYLKRKLRISNFSEVDTIEPYGWIYEGDKVEVNVKYPEDKEEAQKFEQKLIEEGMVIEEVEGITKKYFTSYYKKYETENGKNVIKYYSFENNIHFASTETNVNWEDTIKKRDDRVTLGIVDTYSRFKELDKIKVDGIYSSSEILTKVFSVKSNTHLPLEQFTQLDIDKIIDKNENLAIFDNGNLFARNAWVEGNIKATSGTLGNLDVSGIITLGSKSNQDLTSAIRQVDGHWSINSDGTAYFNNVVVSGKIETAIFEHEKIQTVAGTLLVASEIPIADQEMEINNDKSEVKIYLLAEPPRNKVDPNYDNSSENNTGSTQTFNNRTTQSSIQNNRTPRVSLLDDFLISYDTNERTIKNKYSVIGYGEESNNKGEKIPYIIIQTGIIYDENNLEQKKQADNTISLIKQKKYVLFLGFSETNDEVIGISINASGNQSFYPQDSISIVDINKPGQKPKTLLGLFTSQILSGMNTTLAENMSGTYGLYSDNAYVKGTMVSESNGFIAGITTTGKVEVNGSRNLPEEVVLFAGIGLQQNDLRFYVTKQGYLYAKDGHFEGTIKTSKIIGNGTDYALDIIGETKTKENTLITKAIRFSGLDDNNNTTEFLSFTTDGSYFYNTLNNSRQLFSLLYNDYAIGMFGVDNGDNQIKRDNIEFYKLSFEQCSQNINGEQEEWIQMNCGGSPVAKITSEGFKAIGANDLGDNCSCVSIIQKDGENIEHTIGVNFILKELS